MIATFAAVTAVVLVILAATHQPLGIVGYALFASFDVLLLVGAAVSYYKNKQAQNQEASVVEERPILVPEEVRATHAFTSTEALREGIKPFLPFVKSLLKTALKDYYKGRQDFPNIDRAIDILAHQIDRILEDKKQLFDLLLYVQVGNEYNQDALNRLLAENESNGAFFDKLPEVFDGSLKDLIQDAFQNRSFDRELDEKIEKVRSLSKEMDGLCKKEYKDLKGKDLENHVTQNQSELVDWFKYLDKKNENATALNQVVSSLIGGDQWKNNFDRCFRSFADPQKVEAISTFAAQIGQLLNQKNQAEQRIQKIFDDIGSAKNRDEVRKIIFDHIAELGEDIIPGNIRNLIEWGYQLDKALPKVPPKNNAEEEASVPLLQRLNEAYQPGGLLSQPGVRNLLGWTHHGAIPRFINRLASIKVIESTIGKKVDRLPLAEPQKNALKEVFHLMVPDLLDPLYHGTVDQKHPYRKRIAHILSLFA